MENELLPYQFEPEWDEDEIEEQEDHEDAVNGDNLDQEPEPDRLTDIAVWCQCDTCSIMPTVKECLCCTEDSVNLLQKLYEGNWECITRHTDFSIICLNKTVLEILMHCLREVRGYGAEQNWEARFVTIIVVSPRARSELANCMLGCFYNCQFIVCYN